MVGGSPVPGQRAATRFDAVQYRLEGSAYKAKRIWPFPGGSIDCAGNESKVGAKANIRNIGNSRVIPQRASHDKAVRIPFRGDVRANTCRMLCRRWLRNDRNQSCAPLSLKQQRLNGSQENSVFAGTTHRRCPGPTRHYPSAGGNSSRILAFRRSRVWR